MMSVGLFLLAFAAAGVGVAQEGIAPEALATVKQATVYLELKSKGKRISGGSGVLVAATGDVAYVVTNRQVAEPKVTYQVKVEKTVQVPGPSGPPMPPIKNNQSKLIYGPFGPIGQMGSGRNPRDMLPPGAFPPGWTTKTVTTNQTRTMRVTNAEVAAVLESGTTNERILEGEVVATEPELDLALLRVRGDDLPKGIDLSKTEITETTPVFTFGFPLGKTLSAGKEGPAVRVARGAIASLTEGGGGELARIQVDGSSNPSNSGGPVVDAQGRLVGVMCDGSEDPANLGQAIPRDLVMKMLDARVRDPRVSGLRDDRGLQITLSFEVIDPLGQATGATLYCLPADQWTDVDEPRHPLDNHPNAKKFPLALKDGMASGKAMIDANTGPLLLQIVLQCKEPNSTYVKALRWPTRSAPPAAEVAQTDAPSGDEPAMKEKEAAKGDQSKGETTKEAPSSKTEKATSTTRETKGAKASKDRASERAKEREQRRKEAEERSEQFRKEHGLDKRFGERTSTGVKTRRSELAGPGIGNEFYDEAPSGAYLVGFDFGHREFGGKDMIGAVRPIYRLADADKAGADHGVNFEGATTVKAKEGYAVGGISVRAGLVINGVRVRFMRVKGTRLDPNDAYWSDFIGWDEGGSVKEFAGDGAPAVGVHGRADQRHCRALGLIFQGK